VSRPTCAEPTCDRPQIRSRNGQRWCMFHPDQTAPSVDMLSGKLRTPDKNPRLKPSKAQPKAPKVVGYRVPGRVATAPTVPVQKQPCTVEPCTRLAPHAGRHNTPKAPTPAKPPASHLPVSRRTAASGLKTPSPAKRLTTDPTDIARRYLAGGRLNDLATDLGIGKARLKQILRNEDIRIRNRGEVVGQRGPTPKPLDTAALELLYAAGNNTSQVARHLGVKSGRVTTHLRNQGLLRLAANARTEATQDIRLRLEADLCNAITRHLPTIGHRYLTQYIRDLVLTDLATAGVWPTTQAQEG
jgi:hypothetical protein